MDSDNLLHFFALMHSIAIICVGLEQIRQNNKLKKDMEEIHAEVAEINNKADIINSGCQYVE